RSRVRVDRRERAEVSVLLTGLGRIDRVSGEQFGIARRRLCGRAVAFDQGGDQGRDRRLGRLLTPVLELLPAERAGAVLLVVAIARVEAIEDGELAHFPLPDPGAPDAAAAHDAQRDPDRGLLAGPHGAALDVVGGADGAIARARRLLQGGQRVLDVVVLAELIEGRDHAADQQPDQIEHRVADAQNAGAPPPALALGGAQARLRRVVVGVLLGANAALV